MGDQWDGGPVGWAQNGFNEKGDQCEGWPMSSNNAVGDLWIWGPIRREPMRWGTSEMGDQWDWRGALWKGGPMRWGTSETGDRWDWGPMSSNNVLGDQWVGEPMRRVPMRWGTNERGGGGGGSERIPVTWALKSTTIWLPVQQLAQLTTNRTPKLCITGSLWWESTGDRWIPLTKGWQCGKEFHVMTASCPLESQYYRLSHSSCTPRVITHCITWWRH